MGRHMYPRDPCCCVIMAAEAGGSPMLQVMSSRVTTKGEAMGVYGLGVSMVFRLPPAVLRRIDQLYDLGGAGRRATSSQQNSPGQEAAETLFSDAERAYQQRDYARPGVSIRPFLPTTRSRR